MAIININYEYGGVTTLLTGVSGEITTVGNNATVSSTGLVGICRNSNNYPWAEVELATNNVAAAYTVGTGFSVWFLRSLDGITFEDGSHLVTPQRTPDVVFPVNATTTGQRVTRVCSIPPSGFHTVLLNNGTGQKASGNALRMRPFTYLQGTN